MAHDINLGIGYEGKLPWQGDVRFKEDLRNFQRETSGNAVIMGRTTWESLPGKKPLEHRLNIVVSRNPEFKTSFPNVIVAYTLKDAISISQNANLTPYIIGGSQIYRDAMPIVNTMIITEINESFQCDTYFPYHKEDFRVAEIILENPDFKIKRYVRFKR